jgi:dinuclear metal center YbgI/SA1388 family protein
MKINSDKVMKILEDFAPIRAAQDWDNVGFQIGNRHRTIDKVMVALEVNEQVIDEAIDQSVDVIIVHHPLLFSPLNKIVLTDPIGKLVIRLIENQINLIVAHTNMDASSIGANAYLAEKLDLQRIFNLTDAYTEAYVKFVVFAPEDSQETLIDILEKTGAGSIGNYSGCTYSTSGIGHFRPLSGASPNIGNIGELAEVHEVKIEAIIPQRMIEDVIEKIIKVHPYETPAYDIIPLNNAIESLNMGLVGYLGAGKNLKEFAGQVKSIIGADAVRLVEANDKKIYKVALCTGSGSDMIDDAARMGADVYITGDVTYHKAQHAKSIGLNIIDAGHFETEQFFIGRLFKILSERFELAGYDVALTISKEDINPFETL